MILDLIGIGGKGYKVQTSEEMYGVDQKYFIGWLVKKRWYIIILFLLMSTITYVLYQDAGVLYGTIGCLVSLFILARTYVEWMVKLVKAKTRFKN